MRLKTPRRPVARMRRAGSARHRDVVDAALVMGRHSYGRPEIVRYTGDEGRVDIGAFTSIAPGVQVFLGGNHNMHTVSTFPLRLRWGLPNGLEDGAPWSKGDVHVGNDVWIGKDAMILSGVTIGDGAVVGAGAVVASDVRPYAVVVGNPAREVRRRFNDDAVESLLRVRWWDWPDELIATRIDDLTVAPSTGSW